MKTVLFYSVNTLLNTTNFAAELELMANHLEAGDRVLVVRCKGQLASCHTNVEHWMSRCYQCTTKFQAGTQKIGLPAASIVSFPENLKISYDFLPQSFDTLDELKKFQVEGVDIGAGVASSLISEFKDHKFSPKAHRENVYRKLRMAYYVYEAWKQVLGQVQPDLVYLFNGRLAESRPVLRLCQLNGVECRTIERAGEFGRYNIYPNTLPHDLDYNKRQIQVYWDSADRQAREEQGASWFQRRQNGKDQGKPSFIKSQKRGSLPEGFDPQKRNIVFFNSSEFEYATIKGWQLPFYHDQNDAIMAIYESVRAHPQGDDIHFWLRVHPNLRRGRHNQQMREIKKMEHANLSRFNIIGPELSIDSYALMDACEKVISFSSTMGVEACFRKKPSILIGHAFYEDLDCCYLPGSHEELLSLLLAPQLPAKPQESALKYGYYMMTNGYPFKKFKQTDYQDGLFMGEPIHSGESRLIGYCYYKTLKKFDKLKKSIQALTAGT